MIITCYRKRSAVGVGGYGPVKFRRVFGVFRVFITESSCRYVLLLQLHIVLKRLKTGMMN